MNEHLFEYIATQTSQRNGSRFQRLMRFAKEMLGWIYKGQVKTMSK